MSFACRESHLIRYIIGLPTIMNMGTASIKFVSDRVVCPNWDIQQLSLHIHTPTNRPIPINNNLLEPLSNKFAEARASGDVNIVHGVCNVIYSRHCKPILEA